MRSLYSTGRPLGFIVLFLVQLYSSLAYSVEARPQAQQILRLGNGAEPKELDPHKATGVPESHIIDSLFEGLTSQDPTTLAPVPGVAESWTTSSDGKTYTFKLRQNATWSDGTPLRAQDFLYSWQRMLSASLASEYAYQLYYIKSARDFYEGKIKDFKQVGVSAPDPFTVVVTLENATPFFLALTAHHSWFPVPRHVVEKYPGEQEWTREGKMVGNGIFKLAEWKINKHVRVVRNENYWDIKNVNLSEVIFLPIENLDTEERTFFSGGVDVTNTVPSLRIAKYREEQAAKGKSAYHPYQVSPYFGAYFYRLNTKIKPLDDQRVRKALSLSVDRELLVTRVTQGDEQPATAYTPANAEGYKFSGPESLPIKATAESIAEAKRLLTEAGFPDGKGFPKLEILINTQDNHKRIALALQQMWKKNLGIDIGIQNQEWKVYLDSMQKGSYQIARAGWIADYPDPNTFLDMFVTNGPQNLTYWANPKYDTLVNEAAAATDPAKRFDIFRQIESILLTELPIIPLYSYTTKRLVSEKLRVASSKGLEPWTPNIMDVYPYKHWTLIR